MTRGLLGEAGRGCDEPGHLHDAADPVESPEHRGDRGEGVQRGDAGEVGGVLDRDVLAEQAGAGELPVDEGQLPRGPHEVAGDDRRHVGARGRRDGRQRETELLEAVGDRPSGLLRRALQVGDEAAFRPLHDLHELPPLRSPGVQDRRRVVDQQRCRGVLPRGHRVTSVLGVAARPAGASKPVRTIDPMSARSGRPRGVASALLGMLGVAVVAGLMITVGVAPAIALTGIGAKNGIGLFENLPDDLKIAQLQQKTRDLREAPAARTCASRPSTTQNRVVIPWSDVPTTVKNATLAAEDVRFYTHGGVDPTGIVRALVVGHRRRQPAGRLDHHAAVREERLHPGGRAALDAGGGRRGLRGLHRRRSAAS